MKGRLLACAVGGPARLTDPQLAAPLRAWFLLSSLHPHLPPVMMAASRPRLTPDQYVLRRHTQELLVCLVDPDCVKGSFVSVSHCWGTGWMLSSSAWRQLPLAHTGCGAGVKPQLELGRNFRRMPW